MEFAVEYARIEVHVGDSFTFLLRNRYFVLEYIIKVTEY
jgi:hypothetical protein